MVLFDCMHKHPIFGYYYYYYLQHMIALIMMTFSVIQGAIGHIDSVMVAKAVMMLI